MYSLTIHFGPNAMVWSLLYKEEQRAAATYNAYLDFQLSEALEGMLIGNDDFGQSFAIPMYKISGILLEDMDLGEEARIYRSLANARGEVKARQRAASDPVIRTASQGPSVLQPRFNG